MGDTINISELQESSLSQRFLDLIETLFLAAAQRRDGRAHPKIEEPDEENRGYEGILPGSGGTPDTGAAPETGNPADPDHPDVWVPDNPESQAVYTGENEEVHPSDITGSEEELWQEELDPATEEDIPLRPSEVDIPYDLDEDEDVENEEDKDN